MRPDPLPRLRARFGCTSARARSGFTIIELLIAATISLILTYAVIQMFDYVASEARYGRASIELAGQLRSTSRRLSTDLGCATALMLPYADRHGQGYFEYMEGPGTDSIAMVASNLGTYYGPPYTPTARTSAIDATATTIAVETSVGGDVDDILMFTAYNPDEPFRGRFVYWDAAAMVEVTTIVESKYAEIVIWTARDPENGRVNLYRRALLIRPDLTPLDRYTPSLTDPKSTAPADQAELKLRFQNYYQENDVSVRYEVDRNASNAVTDARFVGNTLADLSRRENRFAHINVNDPALVDGPYINPIDAEHLQIQDWLGTWTAPGWMLAGDLEGNDVLLSEVLAFDVKAYDPLANMQLDPDNFSLNPSDAGYSTATSTTLPTALGTTGAFVDLGYDVTQGYNFADGSGTWFSGNPHPKSRLLNLPFSGRTSAPPQDRFSYRTYCTWSQYYEANGLNENGVGYAAYPGYATYSDTVTDGGTNGLDDDGDGAVDELERNDWWQTPPAAPAFNRYVGEGDTSPPYPKPLRGIQITLRVMEPNSRQVRQMTVVQNFIGE